MEQGGRWTAAQGLFRGIVALTLLLYAILYCRLVAVQFGRVDMDPSPFLVRRVIEGHMVHLVAWWKLAIVGLLLAAYAVLVAFLARRLYRVLPVVQTAALVFGVAAFLVLAIGWPYLGVALHPMRDVVLEEWWIGLLRGIPGGLVVQIPLVATVQSLVILGLLELLVRRHKGNALSPGDAVHSASR